MAWRAASGDRMIAKGTLQDLITRYCGYARTALTCQGDFLRKSADKRKEETFQRLRMCHAVRQLLLEVGLLGTCDAQYFRKVNSSSVSFVLGLCKLLQVEGSEVMIKVYQSDVVRTLGFKTD